MRLRLVSYHAGWRLAFAALVLMAFMTACDRTVPEDAPASVRQDADEFSVMTYNVGAYGYRDRTGDGQADNPKPEEERAAVRAVILDNRPDVLALQEMGGPDVFDAFRAELADAGLDYPFHLLLQRNRSENNIALLSRYPIISHQLHTDDTFSIGDEQLPVRRGFIEADISVGPAYWFRLFVAHLKSKAYDPRGHTEMRRNEARLLNNHVRRSLSREHRLNLLVVGDMNDHVRAAPLRTIMGAEQEYLKDLRPVDRYGELWTYYEEEAELYHRYDYTLASPYMVPEFIPDKSAVIRHPKGSRASAHRPVLAVFSARDMVPADAPLLPSYEYDE